MASEPKTLQQAIQYFGDPDNCLNYLIARRWKDGVVCPICGSREVSFIPSRRVWQCKTRHPKCQFSVKVGTIFEDSPIGLDKWLTAMWMMANCKNGVSSWEIHRAVKVTQKTAWFMLHRIRFAMQRGTFDKFFGDVEADETYIGGKARFMHPHKRAAKITGTGGMNKSAVMGLLERHGPDRTSRVKMAVVPNVRRRQLQDEVRQHVAPGSNLYTDALQSYSGLADEYVHKVIEHAEKYVDGTVHTNSLENFWSLLKRTILGTYVSVEPFHLFRYLDEQAFRFNNRGLSDRQRFSIVAASVTGKRLTYRGLTGKEGSRPPLLPSAA